MANKQHIVQQGECISSIAMRNGFLWQTLWEHPDNVSLKNKRKDPNILFPGDTVIIPDRNFKEYACATEQMHKFVVSKPLTKVTLRLLQDGEPRENLSYCFRCESIVQEGRTNSDGYVNVEVPSTATTGTLTVTDKDNATETFQVNLGHLDPIEEISGIQKRLKNLGIVCEDTNELDTATESAIAAFRAKHKLDGQGIDDALRNKLMKIHGS